MGIFQMPVEFMLHWRRIVLFDMWVVMTMFMNGRLQSDVSVCTYTKRKLAGCIARHDYVN